LPIKAADPGRLRHPVDGVALNQPLNEGELLLSAVLPNYNHGPYLARAIDAIAEQDLPPDEIIVIDDASTDDSRDVLARCQLRHPNLVVICNGRNGGALRALQRGLEAAKGRYVYFAAADDQVLPAFFSRAIDALEAAPTIGLFCAETILLDGGTGRAMGMRPAVRPLRKGGGLTGKEVATLLRRADNFIHTGSSIFRRAALLEIGFALHAGSFSDGLLARKIALTHGIWFMPVPVSIWNIHAGGLSRVTALDAGKARDALAAMPQLIGKDPDFPLWYADLFRRRWRFGSARLTLQERSPDRELLAAMLPNTTADRMAFRLLGPFLTFRLARLTALAWLTFRLRPFRLRDVAVTALARGWRPG
jgi:glycosyltransferase involved in cell wall biosynthesis